MMIMMTRSPGFTRFLIIARKKKKAKSPGVQERGCEREDVFV
jgi:hypothetical protein